LLNRLYQPNSRAISTGRRSFFRKCISAAGTATVFGMLNDSKAADSFEEMAANLPESIQFQGE
jgi:hypothetical protein